MLDRLTQALDFHATALKLRAARQEVISANMANADTPNYKAVDFDFGAALAQATQAQRATSELGMAKSAPAHVNGHLSAALSGSSARALYRVQEQPAQDGNSVDMDRERANFADNAVRYEATLRFLNGQIRTLTSAIQGDR